tara:strand:- start:545 stop:778 length:234 start_codon:yes stop_codon:yes gene_type:complete
LSFEHLKNFLIELQQNQILYQKVSKVATANEIALIAKEFGYEFTGEELKNISNEFVPGVKVKKQDTTPSYNFGEEGN